MIFSSISYVSQRYYSRWCFAKVRETLKITPNVGVKAGDISRCDKPDTLLRDHWYSQTTYQQKQNSNQWPPTSNRSNSCRLAFLFVITFPTCPAKQRGRNQWNGEVNKQKEQKPSGFMLHRYTSISDATLTSVSVRIFCYQFFNTLEFH